ncbi:MAG: hypothetical protein HY897_04025 [Deltaproteobacteria bacterium]|nr:hypothetical protein [Deltaproteobacteria bacterium]
MKVVEPMKIANANMVSVRRIADPARVVIAKVPAKMPRKTPAQHNGHQTDNTRRVLTGNSPPKDSNILANMGAPPRYQ